MNRQNPEQAKGDYAQLRRWPQNFAWLYADQLLSVFAGTCGTFILSWLIYELTGSTVAMGGLWLISFASQWGVQLLAGPLIDRWKRTAVMKLSEAVCCIREGPPAYAASPEQGRSGAGAAWFGQIRAGWRVFSGSRLLVVLALFISVTSFGVAATQAMYIPYVSEVLGGGAAEYG